jgi:glycosyltransferase involved in cell wall biosynthesis
VSGAGTAAGREGARLRIVTYTTLFPNPAEPTRGIFVRNRLAGVAAHADLVVVAPVNAGRNPRVLRTPLRRKDPAGFDVLHPRFAVLPGLLKGWDAALLHAETLPQIRGALGEALGGARPDLVDAHYAYPDGAAASRLARHLGAPFVLTVRGSDLEVLAQNASQRGPIQRTLREARAVVAVSRSLERRAIELGAARDRVHVVPNGVDVGRFRALDRSAAREGLGLPAAGRILLAVARLDPVKGLDFLFEAMAALRAQSEGAGVTLHVVGEGPERRALESAIARLGLGDAVTLHGAAAPEALPLWYAAADVVCLTSHSEGCPNVVAEALACGRPVVATAVGGVPDMVQDGANGFLISRRDAALAADLLARALARTWSAEAIAAGGRRSWETVALEQLAVYRAAAAGDPVPALTATPGLERAR